MKKTININIDTLLECELVSGESIAPTQQMAKAIEDAIKTIRDSLTEGAKTNPININIKTLVKAKRKVRIRVCPATGPEQVFLAESIKKAEIRDSFYTGKKL